MCTSHSSTSPRVAATISSFRRRAAESMPPRNPACTRGVLAAVVLAVGLAIDVALQGVCSILASVTGPRGRGAAEGHHQPLPVLVAPEGRLCPWRRSPRTHRTPAPRWTRLRRRGLVVHLVRAAQRQIEASFGVEVVEVVVEVVEVAAVPPSYSSSPPPLLLERPPSRASSFLSPCLSSRSFCSMACRTSSGV